MRRDELNDLSVFMVVAQELSFTRAAARLGTSQSAVSQTVRRLEAGLGIKLLTRTTRSVAPTDAGEQLVSAISPAFGDIEAGLAALSALRDRPSGRIRITTSKIAAETILWPAISKFMAEFPDVQIELSIDGGLRDIVADRFDAGVRLGEQVAKDMVAVRIGPEIRMAVVASPAYLERAGRPHIPDALTGHTCINLRLATMGGLYAWEFGQGDRELNVRVEGSLIVNDAQLALAAAIDGHGLACLIEDQAIAEIASGRLVRVLEDWCPPFAGFHLYYPDRRQLPPAFALLVAALRHRG
jgi:DNA-binding transcriptional LysR family regulator